jgi:hypothetical protein
VNDIRPDDRNDRSRDASTPPSTRRRNLQLLAFGWLALSLVWAGVIIVTDELAWPLALWVATTLGPLTLLRSRIDDPSGGRPDG